MTDHSSRNTGLIQGVAAYTLWGLMPLYLKLLSEVPAIEVLAHRILWSLGLLLVVVVAFGRVGAVRAAARGRVLLLLATSATLISVNWLVYIWAVNSGQMLAASLGYYINPLVNVALGVAVLGEPIRRMQGVAVALAAIGVAVMAVSGGAGLWISLTLAASFSVYGLIRKTVAIDALGGLLVETMILAPFAAAALLYASSGAGGGAWGREVGTDVLLAMAGVVTAVPLLLFSAAARKLRYATVGLLQYIGPTLGFAQAVLLFGEPFRTVHLVTFGLIWTGCAIYAWDGLRSARVAVPA